MLYDHLDLTLLEALNRKRLADNKVVFIELDDIDYYSDSTLLVEEGEV